MNNSHNISGLGCEQKNRKGRVSILPTVSFLSSQNKKIELLKNLLDIQNQIACLCLSIIIIKNRCKEVYGYSPNGNILCDADSIKEVNEKRNAIAQLETIYQKKLTAYNELP